MPSVDAPAYSILTSPTGWPIKVSHYQIIQKIVLNHAIRFIR